MKRKKGFFSRVNLPVASAYLVPEKRGQVMRVGAILALGVALWVSTDFLFMRGHFLANGPLTSAHAAATQKCEDCHQAFHSATPEKCSDCHTGPQQEVGVYSYSAHYLYRTADFRRDIPSPKEKPCASCHHEHMGRDNDLKAVANEQCLSCHADHEFNQHPVFEATTKPEPAPIKFPHVAHVRELWKTEASLEAICMRCHIPEADGRHFQPLSFERSCSACHLNATINTPRLALESAGELGVLSLETLRARRALGDDWSLKTSTAEFRTVGNYVSKTTVRHRDPWILANLRHLRQKIYPEAGLADLVDASVDEGNAKEAYSDAVASLRSYVLNLRPLPEPEVQAELNEMEAQLAAVEARLADPYASLDETPFQMPFGQNEGVDSKTQTAIEELAAQLSKPCTQCHQLQDLTIVHVDKDQRTLKRAMFDHRAHVIERRCVDCHHKFPEGSLDKGAAKGPEMPATTQNIPDVDTCRQCHNPQGATTDCVSCHDFHPDQSRRAFLGSHLEATR